MDPDSPPDVGTAKAITDDFRAGYPTNNLCQRCELIDFQDIFSWEYKRMERIPQIRSMTDLGLVLDLGSSIDQWRNSFCPLCKLLATMRPPSYGNGEIYQLRAYSGPGSHGAYWELRPFRADDECNPPGLQHTVYLGVVPGFDTSTKDGFRLLTTQFECLQTVGYLCSVGTSNNEKSTSREPAKTYENQVANSQADGAWKFGVRSLVPTAANISLAIDWVNFCRQYHSENCAQPKESLVDFRVIDCKNNRVVTADNRCQYLALSYVWGQAAGVPKVTDNELPSNLPKTIQDAFAVTLSLGYRYLWIDKYCINQNDAADKRTQIDQMGMIYRNADITIVAAAGSDPTRGLPGTNGSIRRQQHSAQVGNHTLVSTLPDPVSSIKRSVWSTRGWTYQEALLSRRLLIFTEDQIYFECHSMHCCESIEAPLEQLHVDNKQVMRKWNRPGLFPFKRLAKPSPDMVVNYISEYTERSFTYQSDILDGFLGIFKNFESGPNSTYQHWGVPIFQPLIYSNFGYVSEKTAHSQNLSVEKEREALGAMENADSRFARGLCWNLKAPSERRDGFPSWSWTGWTGVVAKCRSTSSSPFLGGTGKAVNFKISVERNSGELIKWEKLLPSFSLTKDALHLSRFIHVTAPILRCKFRYRYCKVEFTQRNDWQYEVCLENIIPPGRIEVLVLCQQAELGTSFHSRLISETWIGLWIGDPNMSSSIAGNGQFVLVIDEKRKQYAERIGHFRVGNMLSHMWPTYGVSRILQPPRSFRLG